MKETKDHEHLKLVPERTSADQTVEEIMQKLGCDEIEANFILAQERGEIDGDVEEDDTPPE